jgi:hypothetical protein
MVYLKMLTRILFLFCITLADYIIIDSNGLGLEAAINGFDETNDYYSIYVMPPYKKFLCPVGFNRNNKIVEINGSIDSTKTEIYFGSDDDNGCSGTIFSITDNNTFSINHVCIYY